MTVLVVVEAKVDSDRIDDAIDFLADKFPETREYSGCQDITAYLNEDGQSFMFIEHWDSREQFDKYMSWRQESGTFSVFLDMLVGEPSFRFFEKTKA